MASKVNQQKELYLNLDLEKKRELYACGQNYLTLKNVPIFQYLATDNLNNVKQNFKIDHELNGKLSLWKGDITKLEIDCIVNAANKELAGGGGVDAAIHTAAGLQLLQDECKTLNGCETGNAKITCGYKLPARYIIHTVGPIGENSILLEKCYKNCLNLAKENNLRTIAFPCVSTGVYGYPNEKACNVVLKSIREWLELNKHSIDRIIFCVFQDVDLNLYTNLIPVYFPN